jgi:hypothetical protein
MATLKSKQSGTVTIAAGSASQTASITTVSTDKAFLRFSWNTASTTMAIGAVRGTITDSTTLTFTRVTTTTAITVEWQVVEFSSGVTVQRGSVSHSATTTNVALTTLTTAKSWPIITFSTNNTTWNVPYVQVSAEITSTTNLAIVGSAASSFTVEWQTVEYDNCTSALYSKTVANNSTGSTQAVTSVTQNKTLLFDSFYADDDPHAPENFGRWALTSATVVTYVNPADSGNGSHFHKLYVVSFSDAITTQRASLSLGTNASATSTVTSVTTANTMVHILGAFGTCAATGYGTNGFVRNACTSVMTDSTTVTIARNTGTSTSTCSWELIDFTAILVTGSVRTFVIWVPDI